ncbi:hypothetical protein N7535_000592 [Penicillium sp. DV-2018c]|nr:hypothetical protein N7535_000592 [Penicillium sp. DV-2018c]
MNPVRPWIAAAAEQCLTSYLGQSNDDAIQVDDIEGCLTFGNSKLQVKTAIVVSWGQGDNRHRVTLTDTQNQIDAFISIESPDLQGETSPCPPPVKGGPRHMVELSDIKLVLPYSGSLPEIYLHVNRFQVHHNAIPKGDVPKPKLRKTPNLRVLMTTASEKGRKSSMHPGSNGHEKVVLADSFASQFDHLAPNRAADSSTSQLPLSQYPSKIHTGPLMDNPLANRVSVSAPSEPLELLASSRTNFSSAGVKSQSLEAGQEMNGHRPPEQRSFRVIANKAGVAGRISPPPDKPLYSDLSQEIISRGVDDLIAEVASQSAHSSHELTDLGPSGESAAVSDQQLSKKRTRGSTDSPSQRTHADSLASQGPSSLTPTIPSKKRQRTDTGNVMPTDTTGAGKGGNEQVSPSVEPHVGATRADLFRVSAADPWEGMTEIPLSEIKIPKDQADLLEDLVWAPQDAGVPGPLCNVPPHLLTEWNDISQRRKRLAESREKPSEHSPEHSSEHSPTPTPQDTQSNAGSQLIPWSPSPDRNALPGDTPPSQTRTTTKSPALSGTRDCANQSRAEDEVDVASVSRSASFPVHQMITASNDVPTQTEQRNSRPRESMRGNSKRPESLVHNTGDEEVQERTLLNLSGGQPTILVQKRPPEDELLRSRSGDDESDDDESDDAEMEMSVPYALGETIPLSSQSARSLPSSGPLPPDSAQIIQVVETPVVNTKRPSLERDANTSAVNDKCANPERQNKQTTASQPLSSQQPSSEAVKTSSLSQVPNTYRSEDNQGQVHVSQQAPNHSMQICENESPRLHVLGTQPQSSSVYTLPQGPTQSSTDVVFDSSGPARRHRGSSIFHLDPSDDPSSYPCANVHSLPTSQVNGQSQDSSKAMSSLDGFSQLLDTSQREFTARVAIHAEPLPKGLSSSVRLLSWLRGGGRGYLGKPEHSPEAQTIYEKFRLDYSSYTGNLAHFTEMCLRLQAMRQSRALLQRSFLWDDFVIQHQLEYPRYFAERESQKSKSLQYEDFFCATFTRPEHKKRSLTAHALDLIASKFVLTANPRPASLPARPSFTGNLIENFSNLRARSFGDVPDVHMSTATQILPHSSTATSSGSVRIKKEPNDNPNTLMHSLFRSNNLDQNNQDMFDLTQPGSHSIRNTPEAQNIGSREIDETQETFDAQDVHGSQDADTIQDADDMQDIEHSYHETASVELGGDGDYRRVSPSSDADPDAAPAANPDTQHDSESGPEPPRHRRNWFKSLANVWPTGPVWSDDPNTPFKIWARQDQNLLVEINRRGGTRVEVDERGVIRRPTYNLKKKPED